MNSGQDPLTQEALARLQQRLSSSGRFYRDAIRWRCMRRAAREVERLNNHPVSQPAPQGARFRQHPAGSHGSQTGQPCLPCPQDTQRHRPVIVIEGQVRPTPTAITSGRAPVRKLRAGELARRFGSRFRDLRQLLLAGLLILLGLVVMAAWLVVWPRLTQIQHGEIWLAVVQRMSASPGEETATDGLDQTNWKVYLLRISVWQSSDEDHVMRSQDEDAPEHDVGQLRGPTGGKGADPPVDDAAWAFVH